MPNWLTLLYVVLGGTYIGFSPVEVVAFGAVLKILPLIILLFWFCSAKPLSFATNKQNDLAEKAIANDEVKTAIKDGAQRYVIIALGFSMLGDVILAVDGRQWFVYGLAAFLLGHLAYIKALWPFQPIVKSRLWQLCLGYFCFAAVVMALMAANLGAMFIPVSIYMTVILLMSLSTWHSRLSNPWLIAGGLLFIISDATIGLNRFYTPIPLSGELIMSTYYAAQYALIRGFMVAKTA
jgi:uncharacterized membrane protein YhhN